MAIGVQVWSPTPASNATADSNINFAEGQAPSSVNDSCRSLMASVSKWNADNNGTLVTSGSSTAFTLVTNQIEGSLTAGYTVAFQFHATNDVNATIAVDGLTATPLQVYPGVNAQGGEWTAGSWGKFTYSTTGTGQWVCLSPPGFPVFTNALSGNVAFSSTGTTFTGPSVTQTTNPGTWFVTGGITFQDDTSAFKVFAKLWDATTVIASGAARTAAATIPAQITLSGVITNPSSNIKISAVANTATGSMRFNNTGYSKDCYVTAVRIS